MPRLAPALLLILLALVVVAPAARAQTTGPLIATVTGPMALAPVQAVTYNVTLVGGPTGNVSYAVTYYLTGDNTTGGSPLQASPGRATTNKTIQQLNVTSPTAEGSITLIVTVAASESGVPAENATTSFPITVVKAVVLSATFHNSSSTVAQNVTVRWYIDNVLVGTNLIKQIGANADATVTYNYLPAGLSQGEHTVTVTADLDHDGTINPAKGEVQSSTIFYNQTPPPATGWLILLGIGVFIPVFIGVVAVRRRGQR